MPTCIHIIYAIRHNTSYISNVPHSHIRTKFHVRVNDITPTQSHAITHPIYLRSLCSHIHHITCPPRWRRGSGLDCGSEDPVSIPGIPSPRVGPLMARRLKTSSDVPCRGRFRGRFGTLKTPSCL